ncbi:MAG: hypothetical protein Q8S22_10295 [Eubacteriales bacterium]|jgi:hypothetical protein|nr:hypothetical protein [Eubacteriales bacterium]
MKQRIHPLRRMLSALLALFLLALTAGCVPVDPVVSVGSPLPSATARATPSETVAPQLPTATPTQAPQEADALPSATPEEISGAGAYTITANISESQKTYYSEQADENALRVENSAIAGIDGAIVDKRAGDASSLENAFFFGLNAAALVRAGAQLLLVNSEITAVSLGASGAFASGGRLQLQSSTVRTTGGSSYALAASRGGSVSVRDSSLSTQGTLSPAIVAGAEGEIFLEGGMVATGGEASPVIAATGSVIVSNATLRANSAEAIAVNGGTVTLSDSAISGRMGRAAASGAQITPYCVVLYRDAGALGAQSAFSMTRGALTALSGDLFYATNTDASIYLEGVALSLGKGQALLRACGNDGTRGWGEAGKNGANCALVAKDQTLGGDIIADELSSVSLTLRGETAYTGTVNVANTARAAKVALEDGAVWTLTGNAYLTAFTGRVSGIVTNGFTVYVNGMPLTS